MHTNSSNVRMPWAMCRPSPVACRHGVPGRWLRRLAWMLLPMLLSMPAMTQNRKPGGRNAEAETTKAVESPIKDTSILYKSENRRDPFLNPLLLKKNVKPADEEIARELPPPGIAGTFIAQASLQGTSIRNEQRVAIIRGADTRAYFLKEGDRLFDGYLKSIHDDSVVLVRETKMKSGKVFTQDVTKKLRTP